MIVFIHGFGSSSATSGTAQEVKRLFPEAILVDYDSVNPAASIEKIKQQILEHDYVTLVGISLGGYIARYLANTCDNVNRVLLINPALQAPEQLKQFEGTEFIGRQLPDSFAYLYTPYSVKKDKADLEMFVLLGTKDDVIDPSVAKGLLTGRAKLDYIHCGHRINPSEEFTKWINNSVNTILG